MRRFIIPILFLPTLLFSQTFQKSGTILTGVWDSQAAFADLDNDGDMDLIVSGTESTILSIYTRIYANDGTGTFTEVVQGLPGIDDGSIEAGDYDNDGLVDILLVGAVRAGSKSTIMLKNKGAFSFEEVNVGLPDLVQGLGMFGDYDQDGDLDILLLGSDISTSFNDLYKNENGVYSPLGLPIATTAVPAGAWEDYDLDGDLDFVVSGQKNSFVTLYRNDGADIFNTIPISQPTLTDASLVWGDFNADGRPDLLLMGNEFATGNDIFSIFQNDGNDSFEKISSGFSPASNGNVVVGDIDNDGDIDIVTTGYLRSDLNNRTTCAYINNNGSFTQQKYTLPQLVFSHVAIGDADNDNDLDILITGADTSPQIVPQAFLYLNQVPIQNVMPAIPLGMQSTVDGQQVVISWDASSDDITPDILLSYNVYLGTAPGLENIEPALSSLSTGYRKVVRPGNAGSKQSQTIDHLLPGTYYWHVQSIDGNYTGSVFSSQNSFTIQNEPPVISSFLPSAAVAGNTITISGKNFRGTTHVEINGVSTTFKVVNSQTIRAVIPDGNLLGNIRIMNAAGEVVSSDSFCLIPVVTTILGSTTTCPGPQQYVVNTPKDGVVYDWTVSGGEITVNNNHQIAVNWKEGGNQVLKVVPGGCVDGAEKSLNILVEGPLPVSISGNVNPKTETTERYFVPYTSEFYHWSVSGGGTILASPNSSGIDIKWMSPGTYQLKVERTNGKCPDNPVETIQDITVGLNAFSFGNSIGVGVKTSLHEISAADFDGDNDLDMITYEGTIFENTGSSNFTTHALGLPNFSHLKILDADSDNDPDILLRTTTGELQIYRNDGAFQFVQAWISDKTFPSMAPNVIDYDNDGDLDIFLTGNSTLMVYENKNGIYEQTFLLTGFHSYKFTGASSVIDINRDGLSDIVTQGGGVFLNTNARSFVISDIAYFKSYYADFEGQYITASPGKKIFWSDLNNDGIFDLAELDGNQIKVHRNSDDSFTLLYTSTAEIIYSMNFIDLNNDGFKDMVLSGFPSQVRFYLPDLETYSEPIQEFSDARIACIFDLNQDQTPDLALVKGVASVHTIQLFTNNASTGAGTVIPTSLLSEITGNVADLSWTGSHGYSYNLVVGTQSQFTDVVSPLSNITIPFQKYSTDADTDLGMRHQLSLEAGTYYWSVQSRAPNGAVSAFSTFQSFTILDFTLPAPSDLTLTTDPAGIRLQWTDHASTETGFIIERSQNDFTNFTTLAEIGTDVTNFIDNTVQQDDFYLYRVKAKNATGESDYSNVQHIKNATIGFLPFYESFETDFPKWAETSHDLDGLTEFHIDNNWSRIKMVFGGSHGDYGLELKPKDNPSSAGIMSPLIDLVGTINPYLTFDVKTYLIKEYLVYVSADNGLTWDYQSNFYIHLTTNSWQKVRVSLYAYKNKKVRIRIVGRHNHIQFPNQSFYLDNVRVVEFPLTPALQIVQNTPNALEVSWNTVDHATHYMLERQAGTGAFIKLDSIHHPNAILYDQNLVSDTKYTYRIYAYDKVEDGYSSYGTAEQVVTGPQIVITPVTDKQVKVNQSIDVPVTISYTEGPLSDLVTTVSSDNTATLPNSDISLIETPTGLICRIASSTGVLGEVTITLLISNGSYSASTTFKLILLDPRNNQIIQFETIGSKTIIDEPFTLSATASSGLPVVFASSNPAVASITGNTVTILSVGSTVITASQDGDSDYFSAPTVTKSLIISKATQQITMADILPKNFGDAPFTVHGEANSGLTVTYTSSNNTVATISGNLVTILKPGSTTITASQSGNAQYLAASVVTKTLVVNKADQQITFDLLPDKTMNDGTFAVNAIASSGLTITYLSTNTNVATISGGVVTIKGAGATTIVASQPGNVNFNAALNVQQPLTVQKGVQTITFDDLPAEVDVDSTPILLSAHTSAQLPVYFTSSDNLVAEVNGSSLVVKGPGTITITAHQDGNANYLVAEPVSKTLEVSVVTAVDPNLDYRRPSISPNPAKEKIKIQMDGLSGIKHIVITGSNGVLVHSQITEQVELELPISDFQSGLYLVIIKCNTKVHSLKLIIE